jgi:hypothetical protein
MESPVRAAKLHANQPIPGVDQGVDRTRCAARSSTFGETLEGTLAELVVRNWEALIKLVGGMLIYGCSRLRRRTKGPPAVSSLLSRSRARLKTSSNLVTSSDA